MGFEAFGKNVISGKEVSNMPRGDGKGPIQNKETGRGTGRKEKRRVGRGDGFGAGYLGNCVCPNCGEKTAHQQGSPCYEQKCPKCDTVMTRE
jgi:hypothetical protein